VRVFLDANVLFSASNSGSNIARLIKLLFDRGTAVTSDFSLEEARRNVELKRPAWSRGLDIIVAQIEVVPSARFVLSVALEDKDVPILCTAIRSNCDALATGDKRHFGQLYGQTIDGVQILSLEDLARMLAKDGTG
jgi:predicted nucleic acid-binding protein